MIRVSTDGGKQEEGDPGEGNRKLNNAQCSSSTNQKAYVTMPTNKIIT